MVTNNPNHPVAQEEQTAIARLAEIENSIMINRDVAEEAFIEIGTLLLEAKGYLCKHGEWLSWLEGNVEIAVCKAQRLMRVAKRFPKDAPELCLGYTKLYILAAVPKRKYDEFINRICGGDDPVDVIRKMSKRGLQEEVHAFLGKKKTSSPKAVEDPVAARVSSLKVCADDLFAAIDRNGGCLDTSLPVVTDLRDICENILARLDEAGLEE